MQVDMFNSPVRSIFEVLYNKKIQWMTCSMIHDVLIKTNKAYNKCC